MKILDTQTQSYVDPEADIDRGVASGQYAFEKGVEIPVISPDGERGSIPSEQASKAFRQGFKFVKPSVIAREAKEKEYGEGIGAELAAGALGAARGITFGLSDQALTRFGAMKPEALKLYRDLNPTSSLVGEVTGTVGPALLSGGTSLAGAAAAKTLPALALKAGAKTASKVGGKVASKTVSKIVQNASKAAAGSAVEGALYGTGQLVSEEALGDAEFNAENLIAYAGQGALIGGATGGAIPLVTGTVSKVAKPAGHKVNKFLLKQMGLKNADEIMARQESDEVLESAIRKFKDENVVDIQTAKKEINPKSVAELAEDFKKDNIADIEAASERLGITPTKGMTSGNNLVQDLESSLSQAPTIMGGKVRKEVDAVYDALNNTAKDVFGGESSDILLKTNLTPFEAGEAIKRNLVGDIGERVGKAKAFYDELNEEFGETLVGERAKKLLSTRLSKSDAVKLFKSKDADRIMDMVNAAETINDLSKVRSYIGKETSAAYRAGDYNKAKIWDDAYDTLTRMREKAIVDNAGKAGKDIVKGLNEANKTYASVFKDFSDVSKALKLGKVKNINQLSEALDSMESERIAQRFFSKGNLALNQKLKDLFPESYKAARNVKLADIWEKSQAKGDISLRKFVNNVKKLGKEEAEMLFPDGKIQAIDDIETLINAMPDKVGPSGTAQAQDLFNMLSVVTQARDVLRYGLYKKGADGIEGYLSKSLPVFKQIEKSSNNTKVLMSDSVDKFLGGARGAINVSALNAGESRNYQKALEYLTEFDSDHDGTIEKITEENKLLFDGAPRTSEAVSGKIMQKFQFLKEKAPQDYSGVGYFKNYEPSRSAKAKFMRYYNYANNPYAVFEELKSGRVSHEGVETLRALYPKMYENLYDEVTSRAAEAKNLGHKQRRGLYKLLSIVGASSLIPENLQQLQGSLQQTQQQVSDNKNNVNELRVTGLRDVSQADRFATNLDKSLRKS